MNKDVDRLCTYQAMMDQRRLRGINAKTIRAVVKEDVNKADADKCQSDTRP